MKIVLIFPGHFAFENMKSGDTIEIEDGSLVSDLLTNKGIKKEHQRFIIPIINGVEKRVTQVIKEGDELRLFLPVGGG